METKLVNNFFLGNEEKYEIKKIDVNNLKFH